MKITKILIHSLKIPLPKPYPLSKLYGTLYNTEPVVVEVHTDEGLVGIGECDPEPLFTSESTHTVRVVLEKHLAPKLIGQEALGISHIHDVMDGLIKGMPLAKSAIDMAIHDLIGKYYNMPVTTLLGGAKRKSLPIMGSLGINSPEDNAKQALQMLDDGYTSIMVKIGADIKTDIERTFAIREAVGSDIPLIADANQGWEAKESIYYAKAVKACELVLFEQPVKASDLDGFKQVKREIDIPLAADESVLTFNEAKRMVTEKLVDVLSIKVTKHGGIYPSKKIIDLADAFGVKCLFNSMIEEGITQAASLNLGLTTSNLFPHGHAYFSPLRLDADITNYSDNIKNGRIHAFDKPGLGVEIKRDVMERYIVSTAEIV